MGVATGDGGQYVRGGKYEYSSIADERFVSHATHNGACV
jgi:hypothetical protein